MKNLIYIIKISGEIIKSKKSLENVLKYTKKLHEQKIKVIIVHGGGQQADELSKLLNHNPIKINGRRVTSDKDLEIIKMLYGGSLNLEILSFMKKFALHGIRVSGIDGNLLQVKIRSKKEFDFGFVGDIEKVNPDILLHLLNKNIIPIVSPLACDKKGQILNINADTIAKEIAKSLKVEKLIFFTNVDGIYKNENLIKNLDITECKNLIKEKFVQDGMLVKVQNIIDSLKSGVKEIQILNPNKQSSGTTITKNYPVYIDHFIGNNKGPITTIIGSIHGNEKIGKKLIDNLRQDLKKEGIYGEIFLIFGNPKAYKQNLRFINEDLNRLFDKEIFKKLSLKVILNNEQLRALQIAKILKKTDYCLDIHSTLKPSKAFVYLENSKKHIKLAKFFHTKYLVSLGQNFKEKDLICSTDSFINSNGRYGLTFETGFHKDFSDFQNVYLKTKLFLKKVKSAFFNEKLKMKNEKFSKIHLEIVDSIKPKTNDFKFAKNFSNFDIIKNGELIAFDKHKKIIAPKDLFIIFPKKEFYINKTAGYFAVPI
ncbi:acetylglutamate kinase [Candidatus Peregrinibacteria bacterium RIFOXYB2_FULL_32_7]|nr:MAG: acetylglutamate kinase [Candidatus Peregrinibacteria bacterium RIFOXYB2_FULL_32_7]